MSVRFRQCASFTSILFLRGWRNRLRHYSHKFLTTILKMNKKKVYTNRRDYMKKILAINLFVMCCSAALFIATLNTAGAVQKEMYSSITALQKAEQEVANQIEYLDVIYMTAEKYDIEPELALAMMKVESNFQTDIVSSAGCEGIMQVSPIHTTANLLDLRENVECSFSILSDLKEEGDNLHETLGMYNRGVTGYTRYVENTNKVATRYSENIINKMQELKGE